MVIGTAFVVPDPIFIAPKLPRAVPFPIFKMPLNWLSAIVTLPLNDVLNNVTYVLLLCTSNLVPYMDPLPWIFVVEVPDAGPIVTVFVLFVWFPIFMAPLRVIADPAPMFSVPLVCESPMKMSPVSDATDEFIL